MFRLLPLLLLALLPAAVAAPVPPGSDPPEFGASGLVTLADLQRVRFAAHEVKIDDRHRDRGECTEKDGGEKSHRLRRARNMM